jgi:hypothetical protein
MPWQKTIGLAAAQTKSFYLLCYIVNLLRSAASTRVGLT